jgi:hypothetical protein
VKTTKWLRAGVVIATAVLTALPLSASAGKPGGSSTATALKVNVLTNFYDAHDTNAFNGLPSDIASDDSRYMCSPLRDGIDREPARVRGDAYSVRQEPTVTWTSLFTSSTTELSNPSSVYEDGKDSGTAPLRAQFISSDRVLTIDTTTTDLEGLQTTASPRSFTLDFKMSYDPDTYTSYETAPTAYPFGTQTIFAPGLFEVLGSQSSLLSMKPCASPGCPEGTQIPYARYWFKHPNGSGVQYRLDWNFTRVLRIDTNTWYFIAGDCDGSQTAGLSVLEGNRTKPRMVNVGWFEMPFLIKVTRKN